MNDIGLHHRTTNIAGLPVFAGEKKVWTRKCWTLTSCRWHSHHDKRMTIQQTDVYVTFSKMWSLCSMTVHLCFRWCHPHHTAMREYFTFVKSPKWDIVDIVICTVCAFHECFKCTHVSVSVILRPLAFTKVLEDVIYTAFYMYFR